MGFEDEIAVTESSLTWGHRNNASTTSMTGNYNIYGHQDQRGTQDEFPVRFSISS
jgi:hypothetical protein